MKDDTKVKYALKQEQPQEKAIADFDYDDCKEAMGI